MNKKAIAIIIAGVISLGLIGCGGSSKATKDISMEAKELNIGNLECAAVRYSNKDDIEKEHEEIIKNKDSVKKLDIDFENIRDYASKVQVLVTGLDVKATKDFNEKNILTQKLSIIDSYERNITDSIFSQAIEEITKLGSNNKVIKGENEYYVIYLISICQTYISDNHKDDVQYMKVNSSLNNLKNDILDQL